MTTHWNTLSGGGQTHQINLLLAEEGSSYEQVFLIIVEDDP